MALGVNIVSSFDSKGIRKAITDFKALEGAGNKATFGLRTLDSAATNGFKNIVKYGGIAAIGLGTMATHFVKTAEDAAVADAVLLQVATSMGIFGSQTKFVVDRLSELASNQQLSLGIDEDVIKNTQAKLLTFKNLAVTAGEVGGAFDRATMAALDLAATGFGEATSNAVQLGKALQDPIIQMQPNNRHAEHEDQLIGMEHRGYLTRRYGIKYPHSELARRFSYELGDYVPSWGFHGPWNIVKFCDDDTVEYFIERMNYCVWNHFKWHHILFALIKRGRPDLAEQVTLKMTTHGAKHVNAVLKWLKRDNFAGDIQ
jgi:hypothetical protein